MNISLPAPLRRVIRAYPIELAVLTVALILFSVAILTVHRTIGSDDTVFPVQMAPYHSLTDWLSYRYHTWSGRLFSESFVYIFSPRSLAYWKIVTIALFAVFVWFSYLYYKLTVKESRTRPYMIAAIVCSLFLFDYSVLWGGLFWVTGSMYYFWIACAALVGIYPAYYYALRQRYPRWPFVVVSPLAIAIGASSQEQSGLIIIGALTALLILSVVRTWRPVFKTVPWGIIVLLIIAVGFFGFNLLAPGTAARSQLELMTWLPDRPSTPLLVRANYSYRWFLDGVINHTGFTLFGLWICSALLLAKQRSRSRLDNLLLTLLVLFILFMATKGQESISFWFNFYDGWKFPITSKAFYLPLLFWPLAIASTLLLPLRIYGLTVKGIGLSYIILLFLVSTAVITLSPTMYASGWRTMFIPCLLLSVVLLVLLQDTFIKYWAYRKYLIGLLISLAFIQYFYVLSKMIMT